MISPRLQEAIASPEGITIAGLTAIVVLGTWWVLHWALTAHERRQRRRITAEIEAAANYRKRPEDAARWTP